MPLSPGAADGSCDDRSANAFRGDVHGQLVQARDIHGGVTIHASQAPPPPLVDVSLDTPRPATAVRGREELHADRAGTLGPEHPDTLDTAYQLGLVSIRRERWDEAGEILSEVREASLRAAGEEDPLHLFAAQNRAYVTMRLGDSAAAETGFRRVHRVRERVLGAGHRLTADAAYYVGRAAQERGEFAEALGIFTGVLRNWEERLGEEHPQVETVRRHIDEVAEPGPGTTR
ncbi:tetratricopeptide repeat protein [Nocardiopsis tropica]|uniref:Tetratricopeptide repeat protein n=1 Tax=Nocardiopsis tropica TaxID=109330 RepID=A0ABV1ZWI9_9ACTN